MATVLLRRIPGRAQQRVRTCHNTGRSNVLSDYVRRVVENPLPVGAGALVVGFLQWKRIKSRNERELSSLENSDIQALEDDDIRISCYRSLPLRHVSRAWGFINEIYLPTFLRSKVLGLYSRQFQCNLDEAEDGNLENYENLGQFFRRRLKAGVRPISAAAVVSPCDGKVLGSGPVPADGSQLYNVKGLNFSLKKFLGANYSTPDHLTPVPDTLSSQQDTAPVKKDEKALYQCVLYLAPGDYHGFHSPVDWTVKFRRHFPGELLSVSPAIVSYIRNLYEINERVVYLGEWEHGFFSMTAVGATNVGSVKISCDPELSCNQRKWEADTFHQKSFQEAPVAVKKGDYFGEFNLGSSIVLVFEAPADFSFDLVPGGEVRVDSVKVMMLLLERGWRTVGTFTPMCCRCLSGSATSLGRWYSPITGLKMETNVVGHMDRKVRREIERMERRKIREKEKNALLAFYKKSVVINKSFKEDVARAMGEVPELRGHGILVTRVAPLTDFSQIKVFWASTRDTSEKGLSERVGSLLHSHRREVQARLREKIGEMPEIVFFRDVHYLHEGIMNQLISKADVGPDGSGSSPLEDLLQLRLDPDALGLNRDTVLLIVEQSRERGRRRGSQPDTGHTAEQFHQVYHNTLNHTDQVKRKETQKNIRKFIAAKNKLGRDSGGEMQRFYRDNPRYKADEYKES